MTDIFSGVFKRHSRAAKGELLSRGIGDNIPSPDRMLQDWQKPWLFARVLLFGLLMSVGIYISYLVFASTAMIVMLCMLPAFVVPLATMIFYWEMNIPGNVSIYEALLMMLLGGILSLTVTGIVRVAVADTTDLAFLLGPFPEELAKLAIVYLLLKRSKFSYGLQGILIGGAVGVGFSAIESAGYAFGEFIGGGDMVMNLIIRGLLSIGGHVVWVAIYGGALALAKGKGKLTIKCLADPLFVAAWSGAFLLHTVWNFSIAYMVGKIPNGLLLFLYNMETMWIKHIVLIVLGWIFLMYIMRKSIRQIVRVDAMYQEFSEKKKTVSARVRVHGVHGMYLGQDYELVENGNLVFGRNVQMCTVRYPDGTAGISSVHCELVFRDGRPVLIDRNSTYGTYVDGVRKLEPNVPYPVQDQTVFSLGGKEQQFRIEIQKG